jgi:hypothetical protein
MSRWVVVLAALLAAGCVGAGLHCREFRPINAVTISSPTRVAQ